MRCTGALFKMMTGIYLAGRFISFYGILIAAGIIIAGTEGYFLVKHRGLDFDYALLLAAYGVSGGMAGAKILYLFVVRDQIEWNRILDWDYMMLLLKSGYVFYGGLIGGLAGIWLGGRLHKLPAGSYLETCIPCLPLAHAFGRIGCHLVGCCYGIRYHGIGHIIYHAPSFAPVEVPLFPVQLLEAAGNIILAMFLTWWIWRKRTSCSGILIYLAGYGFWRFLLETFFRADAERGKVWMFSTSQWISIFLILGLTVIGIYERVLSARIKKVS